MYNDYVVRRDCVGNEAWSTPSSGAGGNNTAFTISWRGDRCLDSGSEMRQQQWCGVGGVSAPAHQVEEAECPATDMVVLDIIDAPTSDDDQSIIVWRVPMLEDN